MADLIDRQAAIDALKQCYCGGEDVFGEPWIYEEHAIKAINTLPSAQPMRKKGEWIYNSPVTMKCDQCEYVVRDWFVKQFRYCPLCGADMRGNINE